MSSSSVFITGCSSGFGKLAAKTFQQKGWNVIATMCSPEQETELTELEGVWLTRLDICSAASIDAEGRESGQSAGSGGFDLCVCDQR